MFDAFLKAPGRFPFELRYVKLFTACKTLSGALARCVRATKVKDKYFMLLEELASYVKMDARITEVAKKCKERHKIFQKIREMLDLKGPSNLVRTKLKRFVNYIVHWSGFDGDIDKVMEVIESHWNNLSYTYDDEKIPRTIQN